MVDEREEAISDGKRIFLHEFAAWQAMSHFRDALDTLPIEALVVVEERDSLCVVFYSMESGKTAQIYLSFWLDNAASPGSERPKVGERAPSVEEIQAIALRKAVEEDWAKNEGGFYRLDELARMSMVVFAGETGHRAYIMARPIDAGQIFFGNDYLLKLDGGNAVVSRECLHPTLHALPTQETAAVTAHLHEGKGQRQLITATDISSLMLYAQFTNWKQHLAIGKNYVSTWDILSGTLTVESRKNWDKAQRK